MSRAGYSDDCDDPLQEGRWRAAVNSAIRGKRGQAFLREALAALDAMADKKLIAGDLVVTGSQAACGEDQIIVGSCCLLGAVAVARKMDVSDLDPEDIESTASRFGLADAMTREIVYWNDEGGIGPCLAVLVPPQCLAIARIDADHVSTARGREEDSLSINCGEKRSTEGTISRRTFSWCAGPDEFPSDFVECIKAVGSRSICPPVGSDATNNDQIPLDDRAADF